MSSYNKVVVNGVTKIDLTQDTVRPDIMLAGYSAHGSDGSAVVGTLFSNRPTNQTIVEVITDSSGRNIQDSSSGNLTVGMEYMNHIKYNNDILELQNRIAELERLV